MKPVKQRTLVRARAVCFGSALVLLCGTPLLVHADDTASAFDPWTDAARYEFEVTLDLSSLPAKAHQRVDVWLPTPAETSEQRVLKRVVAVPFEAVEKRDALGNQYLHIVWEGAAAPNIPTLVRYLVERKPSRGLDAATVKAGSADDPQRFLRPARKIPLDGLIAQLGAQESRGLESDAEKIRGFYDYVLKNMRYSKHGKGWGEGDAIWACTEKYGNCTDFHSLFMGMARSQGIPARFRIGFPIPSDRSEGELSGYHCWAEAWDSARGWVPFDASEAWKAKRFDDYFGTLPSDRILLSTGRDLVLEPAQGGEPLNYFVYPYAEVDGKTVEKPKVSYRFRRLGPDTARAETPQAAPDRSAQP